ncbi:MAG: hypothetical protein EBR02_10325 [Alphaproteobacteria bacterium]|nr:hypothetical protein [Alphaproteobacteria bacterium]
MIKHSGGSDSQDEYLTAFWWLQNAGLINNVREDGLWGSFSVVPTVIAGGNSNGGNAHWKVLWFDVGSPTASPDNQYFSDANAGAGHYYWLTNYLNYTVILPVEAQAIDSKLDDGLPRSGKVLAGNYDGAEGGNGDSSLPIFDASGEGFGDGLPQSGPAGATSDYCITNDTTPKYNILNTSRHDGSYGAGSSISSLCTLTVKASF